MLFDALPEPVAATIPVVFTVATLLSEDEYTTFVDSVTSRMHWTVRGANARRGRVSIELLDSARRPSGVLGLLRNPAFP